MSGESRCLNGVTAGENLDMESERPFRVAPGSSDRQRAAEEDRLEAQLRVLTKSLASLREELARSAAVIAETEEKLADTFEFMARNLPHHAQRLIEEAKAAREYAAIERDRVSKYRSE